MTRNRFILLLENQLAETFPGWRAREQELTESDIAFIQDALTLMCAKSRDSLWMKVNEVKA